MSIFILKTETEVDEFCKLLKAAKAKAPVSMEFTIAISVNRLVSIIPLFDEKEEKLSVLERNFREVCDL